MKSSLLFSVHFIPIAGRGIPDVEGLFSTGLLLSVVEVSDQNGTDWTMIVLAHWSHDNSNDSGIP
jgi:hypothetical protein